MPKKEKIQEMFDGIAADYDRLNHIMSLGIDRGWRRRAIKEIVRKEEEQEILDIACGTGDFSIAIAKAMSPGSRVTALDISEGMLAVMREKLAAEGLEDRVSVGLCDCEDLGFADASFDRAAVAFGIRNFEHREKGLREILRVLKPGGKLVILELSVPSNPVIRWFYKLYFTGILPIIGGKISGDKAAYRYLPASVLNFPGKKEWMATMASCGYAEVRHKAFTFGICRMYVGVKP